MFVQYRPPLRHTTPPIETGFFGRSRDVTTDPVAIFLDRCSKDINYYFKHINFKPTWQQKELVDAFVAGDPNIAVRSGKGPGKCVTADMEVLTDHGYIKAGALEGKKFQTLSLEEDTLKLRWNKASCELDTIKEVVRVSTSSGNSVEVSIDHPVYTQRGWIPAGDLTTHDLVITPRGYEAVPLETPQPMEAEFIGYMSGDGNTVSGSMRFSQESNSTLVRMKELSNSFGFEVKYEGQYDYRIVGATGLCREYGIFGKKSIDKRIPERVWRMGNEGLVPYFKAFMECDGYVTKDGIGVCLGSKGFIKDIQALLARWGVSCSMRYKKAKCGAKYFDAWRVEVSGSSNLRILDEKVGDIKRKSVPKKLLRKKGNPNNDPVPITLARWNEILAEICVPSSVPRRAGYRGYSNSLLGRHTFESFVKEFRYTGKYARYAKSDVQWVRVVALKRIGEHQTYAVSVERDHNFVCENVVVHNTGCTGALVPWWSLVNTMSQAVITAPTMAQCQNVWLSQAQKWIMNGDKKVRYFFKFTGTGYGIRGHQKNEWGGYVRTATTAENFQGIHNEKLLVYCEEASGISRPIMQAIQDTLTGNKEKQKGGGQNRWLAVGNPNTRTCRFFDFFHSLAGNPWVALHWNAEETPLSVWFSGERNKEIEEEFGKDSDVYRVAVLGQFPTLDPDSILAEDEVNNCFGQEAYIRAFNHPDTTKQFGIDLARMGGDECVTATRHGRVLLGLLAKSKIPDTNDWLDMAVAEQDTLQWEDSDCTYVLDTSGLGESSIGYLGSGKRANKNVHEFYSQNKAYESDKYANKISEAWFGLRKKVRAGDIYLGPKVDRKLVLQLTLRKYCLNKDGLLLVESKDDYKKRLKDVDTGGELGKSPDRADAVVMAFYDHAEHSQRVTV